MSGGGDRERMEDLRIFVRVWQKTDFIRGMVITTYIPIFGLMQFYRREVSTAFALLLCVAVDGFTWINGNALRMHSRLARGMVRAFRSLNRRYPMLSAEMGMVARTQAGEGADDPWRLFCGVPLSRGRARGDQVLYR